MRDQVDAVVRVGCVRNWILGVHPLIEERLSMLLRWGDHLVNRWPANAHWLGWLSDGDGTITQTGLCRECGSIAPSRRPMWHRNDHQTPAEIVATAPSRLVDGCQLKTEWCALLDATTPMTRRPVGELLTKTPM